MDNSTVLGNIDWYYGLDEMGGSDIDFATVVLHEFGHGLDFFDLINSNGRWATQDLPGIYDRFLEIGDGTALIDMNNSARRRASVSNDLFWSGANGIAGNSGSRPKLYAPNPLESGSSKSHLDETVHGNELMSPFYSGPDHTLSDMEFGMLADMGWSVTSFGAAASAQARESRENSTFNKIPIRDLRSWTVDLTSPTIKTSSETSPSSVLDRPISQRYSIEQNLFIGSWFAGQLQQSTPGFSRRADTSDQFLIERGMNHHSFDQSLMTTSSPLKDHPATYVGKQGDSAFENRLSAIYWELADEPEAVDEATNELTFGVEQLDDFFASIGDLWETKTLLLF